MLRKVISYYPPTLAPYVGYIWGYIGDYLRVLKEDARALDRSSYSSIAPGLLRIL